MIISFIFFSFSLFYNIFSSYVEWWICFVIRLSPISIMFGRNFPPFNSYGGFYPRGNPFP